MPKGNRMTPQRTHVPLVLMYLGLGLTMVATVAPLLARELIEDHVRSGYPSYSDARVGDAATAWMVALAVIGVLGTAGWLLSIWAVRRQRHAEVIATVVLAAGLAVSLTAALTPDTSGEVGLAPALGAALMLPCVAGLGAVLLMWRDRLPLR